MNIAFYIPLSRENSPLSEVFSCKKEDTATINHHRKTSAARYIAGAFSLSAGIAIQNFPEGAIISMPLRAEGISKGKAFLYGVLSGAVEPFAALITILAASFITPALPYLLSFAAGAMMYVVVEELIPEMSAGRHSNLGTICFAVASPLCLRWMWLSAEHLHSA